jgi:general secretion pathway protein A
MYAQFFGLKHTPFSIAPDPRYLFMSERHREALAHLLYGLDGGGGFVLLTGEIGAGKTTVCRCFLEQIPRRCNVAYIFNPKLTVTELLKSVCEEFRIPHPASAQATVKDYVDPINEFLLKTHAVGQNNVLIIDEAQNLSADVLEQLRLLTNLETSERKLLQIVLIGQPELRDMLARPELEQLAQRVIARFHLEALSEPETAQYIRHRLAVAGMQRATPFSRKVMRRIHTLSRGIPRRINLLCDRAMLGAYGKGRTRVDDEIVAQAAREVFDRSIPAARTWALWGARAPWAPWAALAVAGLGLAGGGLALGAWWANGRTPAGAAAPVAAAASAPVAAAASRAAPPQPVRADTMSAGASAPQASPERLASTAELVALLGRLFADETSAWRALARQFGADPGSDDPCQALARQQLQCHRSASSVALIRLLDRPGFLTLHGPSGETRHVLLTGLDEDTAVLDVQGRAQPVSLPALAAVWKGDFATLWRAPAGYNGMVLDGHRGPVVERLAADIARLDRGSPPAPGQTLDEALKARVYAFQLGQGLKPDGIAGPTTFMQLNRATGVDEPRLQHRN